MPQVGFEHTIPVFERTKTIHVVNRSATVFLNLRLTLRKMYRSGMPSSESSIDATQ
jgi:hypothetical protein